MEGHVGLLVYLRLLEWGPFYLGSGDDHPVGKERPAREASRAANSLLFSSMMIHLCDPPPEDDVPGLLPNRDDLIKL